MDKQGRNTDRTDGGNQSKGGGSSDGGGGPDNQSKGGGSSDHDGPDNQSKGGGSSDDGGGPDNQSKGGGSSNDGGPDNQSKGGGSSDDGGGPDNQSKGGGSSNDDGPDNQSKGGGSSDGGGPDNQCKGGGSSDDGGPDNQSKGGGSSGDGGPDNQSKGGGSSVDGGPDNQSKGGVSSVDGGGGPHSQEEKELKEILQKLKKRMSPECFTCAERLTQCSINKTPTDPKDLLDFFRLLKKELPQKASLTSTWSSPFNWFCPGSSTVKVFSVVTGQAFGADEAILRQLKKGVAVETNDLQDCDVIIVFCSVKFRVESDVNATMRKDSVSSGNKPVILVVMHHTRDPDFSPGLTQWSEMYPNVKMVTHILFHETQPGLLPNCPRNHQAIQQIQKELRSST